MDALGFLKSHPVSIAVGVFVVGLIFILSRGGGSSSGDTAGIGAFYAAQAASKTSGDQVAIAQIGADASTTQALAYFDAQKSINSLWADNQLATTNANNTTSLALAPYRVQDDALQALASVASQPGQTVTTTKTSNGFLGIGGGSKTSSTYIPNQSAVAAGQSLNSLFTGLFSSSHVDGTGLIASH